MENDDELDRWLRLFCYAARYHFGTLWRFRGVPRKREYPGYDQGSPGQGHLGMSIDRRSVASLQDTVRMLIGSRFPYGRSIVVTDARKGDQPERKRHYSVMRPVAVMAVKRHGGKPQLDAGELAELEAFLQLKGGGR